MVKIILSALLLSLTLHSSDLERRCLSCHAKEQVPSTTTYNRYLMKYSSKDRIAKAIHAYIKDPKPSASVMPPQFFLKFSLMPKLKLDDATLRQEIGAYIRHLDIKKRLKLQKLDSSSPKTSFHPVK